MPMPSSFRDRDQAKFRDATNNRSKVAVEIENETPLDISFSPTLPTGYVAANYFNQITSVPSGSLTTILSKTVLTTALTIDSIELSGDNKAEFRVFINASLVAVKRTGFIELNHTALFGGLMLQTLDVLEIRVIHERPYVGTFEARVVGVEQT